MCLCALYNSVDHEDRRFSQRLLQHDLHALQQQYADTDDTDTTDSASSDSLQESRPNSLAAAVNDRMHRAAAGKIVRLRP